MNTALSFDVLAVLVLSTSAAIPSATIQALGDEGHVYLGQPAYADVLFVNPGDVDISVEAGAPVGIWEVEGPGWNGQKCREEGEGVGTGFSDPSISQTWLRAGEQRLVREIIVQSVCTGALSRPGLWRVRIGIRTAATGTTVSEWKAITVIDPTGREAQAISAFPNGSIDFTEYLKKFGDTAVAGKLLRRQDEVEEGPAQGSSMFAQRVSRLAKNQAWLQSAKSWRLQTTERFLSRHPQSYFAADLQVSLAAMYAVMGDPKGVERVARALQRTRPDEASAILGVAERLRAQGAVTW